MNDPMQRKNNAKKIRDDATNLANSRPHFGKDLQIGPPNEEEQTYPNLIANFHKSLPHQDSGEVDVAAYQSFLKAIQSGDPIDFQNIILDQSFVNGRGNKKLTNPQSGLAYELEGPDGHAVALIKKGSTDLNDINSYFPFPSPPKLNSAEAAGEIVELYWMSLIRDVHFTDYRTDNLVKDAITDLNKLSDFHGPKIGGKVTEKSIFRGSTDGDLVGPYISQFMLKGNKDIVLNRDEDDGWLKYGTCAIDQRHVVAVPGKDFVTNYKSWISVQRGEKRDISPLYKNDDRDPLSYFENKPKFLRNLRDLATFVHYDALYQAYLSACMYLLRLSDDANVGAKILNEGNPYKDNSTTQFKTQYGFGTFGGPHILSLVCEVATRALKSVWYTKWFLYRRLRPEAIAGLIHIKKASNVNYPIHIDALNSSVLQKIFKHNEKQNEDREQTGGTYLLPLAFPEGSPAHPSYGAGHATVAGACVTILKAWFDNTFKIDNPVEANDSGNGLHDYEGSDKNQLTLGGELNKLAANVAIGRNGAGVHYRSDYWNSLRLGEAISIGILQEQKLTYNENFTKQIRFTRFDGTEVKI